MKVRHVYSTPSLEVARTVMRVARDGGIADRDLQLVARGDIEEARIPDRRKEADTDLKPAAIRGALIGAVVGVLAAVVASTLMTFPLTVNLLLGGAVGGILLGTLGAMLSGSSVPDPLRRHFHSEIEAGKVLVVIDATTEQLAAVDGGIRSAGATLLPYDGLTAAT